MFSPRSLKSNIIINMAALLLIGMLLIDFVTIITVQRVLIQNEIEKSRLLLAVLAQKWMSDDDANFADGDRPQARAFQHILPTDSYTCLLVLDEQNRILYESMPQNAFRGDVIRTVRQTIQAGRSTSRFVGTTWGVFWFQNQYVILTMPITHQESIKAGAGMMVSLENVYLRLQRAQSMLLIYMVINAAILTLIGVYRLSKIYLEPIYRMVKRADNYQENEDVWFAVRKEDNELNQLSKALNQMLLRMSKDKEHLRTAINSLEKANIDLKKAQREMIQAEKLASVGRLSSGIAHEIGNPIGIIMGYLELMKREDATEGEKIEYILRSEDELNRIRKTIRQLLDFSRPASDGLAPVKIHAIVDDLADIVQTQPFMADITLELRLTAEKDVVMADANLMRQVFLNLMINAADAIASHSDRNDGRIIIQSQNLWPEGDTELSAELSQPMLKLQYIDNGQGIQPENLGAVFDPFFTTKAPGKGTGLGLAVSYMIVESLGGTIAVGSQWGEGTTMTIMLPLMVQTDTSHTQIQRSDATSPITG